MKTAQPTTEVAAPMTMEIAKSSAISVSNLLPVAQTKPRDTAKCFAEALKICTISEEAALKCFYHDVPVGRDKGKDVLATGPGIGLAETLVYCLGNIIVRCDDVEEADGDIIVRGTLCDIESVVGIEEFIRRRIVTKEGKRYSERQINRTLEAASSFLFRKLVFRYFPRPLVDEIFRACVDKAIGSDEDLPARRMKVIKYWDDKGVNEATLLQYLGCEDVEQITKNDVLDLLMIDKAIKARRMTIQQVFFHVAEPEEAPKNADALSEKLEKAREAEDIDERLRRGTLSREEAEAEAEAGMEEMGFERKDAQPEVVDEETGEVKPAEDEAVGEQKQWF